jgi:hypothetical protein
VGYLTVAALLIVAGTLWTVLRLADPQAVVRRVLWKSAVALGGWVLSNLYLVFINGRFINRGKLKRLMCMRR